MRGYFLGSLGNGAPRVKNNNNTVIRDIAVVISTGTSLGLHLQVINVVTRELVHPQGSGIKSVVLGSFKSIAPDEATLLGAPLLPSKSLHTALDTCCSNLSEAIGRLGHIEADDALALHLATHHSLSHFYFLTPQVFVMASASNHLTDNSTRCYTQPHDTG